MTHKVGGRYILPICGSKLKNAPSGFKARDCNRDGTEKIFRVFGLDQKVSFAVSGNLLFASLRHLKDLPRLHVRTAGTWLQKHDFQFASFLFSCPEKSWLFYSEIESKKSATEERARAISRQGITTKLTNLASKITWTARGKENIEASALSLSFLFMFPSSFVTSVAFCRCGTLWPF